MMHMTFYFGVDVTLWFDSWKSDSLISYIFMLIGVGLFAVAHEGLHRFRQCCSSAVVSRCDGMSCTRRTARAHTTFLSLLYPRKTNITCLMIRDACCSTHHEPGIPW